MKPLHLAVAAAVLLVAVFVAFLATTNGGRGGTRRADEREPATAGEGPAAPAPKDAGTGDVTAGSGGLSITVRIADAEDRALGGAVVELDRGIDAVRATADAEGKLRVKGLTAGLYDLRARHGRLAGSLHFELLRTTDLGTLRLSATASIRGHVYGPRGEPVAGARVEACLSTGRAAFDVMTVVRGMSQPEEIASRTTSGDDGAYELLVPEGTYGLRADADGFAQEGEPARAYSGGTDGVDFWLTPGALLRGRVVDARQGPVAGARVLVADMESMFSRRLPKAETATGADGAFSMVVQPAQQSMLVVRAAGYASSMQPLQLPQTDLVIVLEEGVTLRFEAVDAERPEIPAPRVKVIAIWKGGFGAGETDDLGRLEIENLPTKGNAMGGEQRLFLWGGGFIAQEMDIASKEPVAGVVDLGTLKLAPGGVVRGRVLDKTTGEGVAEARVRSFGGLDPQLEIFGSVAAVSARDGSFTLTGVPLQAHTLAATHPDYASDFDPATIFSGMRQGGGGGPALFPEGSRDIERNVEMTPAESVTGIVLGPDGSAVGGASVEEVGDETRMMGQMLGIAPLEATSDANGAFVLKGLRPGREVQVAARHRDYGPSEAARVRAGEPATLRLAEPLAVKGVVVDEEGSPIAGVRVQAERAAPDAPSDSVATRPSITDEEGRYLVRNAPAGELTVTFDHPDYAVAKVVTTSQDLGRTVLARGGVIEGTAVDGDGKPVAGLPVFGWSQEPTDGGRRNASTTTDEKGRFAMRGLAEGDYQLRTWDQDWYAKELKVRTGTLDARLVVRAAARLLGRVTARGQPVAGASANVRRGDDYLGWAETKLDGTFVIAPLPPDEPFDVAVEHDAFRPGKFEAVRASDRTQEFVLQAGAEVRGRVADAQGRGVSGAQVQVRVAGQHAKSVRTDATGGFTAGGLDDGPISVSLHESGQGFIPTEWLDVAAGARDVRLLATPGESIAGVVRDREGRPVRQVSLQALDAAGEAAASTWVWKEDGAFELRGLRPGTYTVRASRYEPTEKGDHVQPPRFIEVPGVATGTKNLDVRIQ